MKKIYSTIRGRMTVGLLALAILVLVQGLFASYFIRELDDQLNQLSDEVVPIIETTDDLIANLWESAKVANEIQATNDIAELNARTEEIIKLAKTFDENRLELEAVVTNPEHAELIRNASKEQDEFLAHTLDMSKQHLAELQEAIKAETLLDEFDINGAKLIVMLDEFATENEAEMRKAEDQGDELAAREYSTASQVNDILGELFENDYPVVSSALKLQRLVIEMQDTAGEYLAERDPSELEGVRQEFLRLSESAAPHFEILTRLAETDEDRQDAKDLIEAFTQWAANAQADEALFDSYRDQLAAEEKADELTELLESDVDNADAELEKVAAAADAFSDGVDEVSAEKVNMAMMVTFGLVALSLLIAAFIAFMVYKTVLAPIDGILERLTDIAEGDGDLTKRVDHKSNDELGQLAKSFNHFISRVNGIVKEISDSTGILVDTVQQQAELANAARQTIGEQKAETDSAANALCEMEATTTEVAQNALDASDSASEANQAAADAKGVVEQSIVSVQNLASEIENASHVIGELTTDVSSIGLVLDVISDIAEQTNLLALNAAIEAARAGEQGRGFAVVADEVRSLAARTRESTDEIQQTIAKLQRGSANAVNTMTRSKQKGDDTVEQARQGGEALDRVTDAIGRIDQMNAQIATAAEEQTATMKEINRVVDTVVEASDKSLDLSKRNGTLSDELNGLGGTLNELVAQFKV